MSVSETQLFKILKAKCDKGEACPINPNILLGVVEEACKVLADRLNRAYKDFADYTLHDEHHAERVVFLMDRLLREDVGEAEGSPPVNIVEQLSVIDLALLILAAYGHDIGMALAGDERKKTEESIEYRDFLLRHEGRWQECEAAREQGDAKRSEFLRGLLFQDFLRSRHHIISRDLIRNDLASKFVVEGKSLADGVAALCHSHGVPVNELASLSVMPFGGKFRADIPFLACVLRLADYLDLDAIRAPESLLRLISPENQIARREWRKHQANTFYVSPRKIEFRARFTDFFEEKALRDSLAGIEQERRECLEFLRQRNVRPMLLLDTPVAAEIESDGYLFEEFRFQLEYREIITLLMGTRLYRDERVFIRELLQNALDACRHAEAARKKSGGQHFSGRISVRTYESGNQQVVEIADNGSGMTKTIIRDYFMRVGRSFYRSFAFRRQNLGFLAVSQFGIGVLSCFMNSDYIEVETCPDPIAQGGSASQELQALKLEINGPMEFFVVKPSTRSEPGTTLRIFLKKRLTESVGQIVQRYLGRIPYTVEIYEGTQPPFELAKEPFDFQNERFAGTFVEIPDAFGYQSRDLVFDGQFGFDVTGRIRFFMLDASGRRYLELAKHGKYSFVGFTAEGETFVNVHQLTPEARRSIDDSLKLLRELLTFFSGAAREDVTNILRQIERLCEFLTHQHESEESRALLTSISAQIASLTASASFQSVPASMRTRTAFQQLMSEIEAFVSGNFRLFAPRGILTQDGINVSGMINLPVQLQLGIGYLYNLDFCGKYRFSLNAARDTVLLDDQAQNIIHFMHERIGKFLGTWFRDEKVPEAQIRKYLAGVPESLSGHVAKAFGS